MATAAAAATLDEPLVTRCAWCARYHVGDEWLEEATIHGFVRPGRWDSMLASHGICPACVADLRRRGLSR